MQIDYNTVKNREEMRRSILTSSSGQTRVILQCHAFPIKDKRPVGESLVMCKGHFVDVKLSENR